MAAFTQKIQQSLAANPATAVMRNYLGSCSMYETRYYEYSGRAGSQVGITIRCARTKQRVLAISEYGTKNQATERLYWRVATILDAMGTQRTQGLDETNVVTGEISLPEEKTNDDKHVNVIISGAEDTVSTAVPDPVREWLMEWSSTEPYFDFVSNNQIMGRWMALDTVRITGADQPTVNGGLKKLWRLPEDLMKGRFSTINILPMRGFTLGKYDLEFKVILQANPFQAGCIMVSTIPNPYGLLPAFGAMRFITHNPTPGPSGFIYPEVALQDVSSYLDWRTAVQRPHVILDISNGGEGVLQLKQKYHKTLVRNVDYAFVGTAPGGIRGSYMAGVALHVISPLASASGANNFVDARVFYRFVEAKMTGMTQVLSESAPTTVAEELLKPKEFAEYINKMAKTQVTQGGVMSALTIGKMAVDVAGDIIGTVERIGTKTRKGFAARNRDKPNDVVSALRAAPRPRTNFANATGTDDAIVLSMGWDEMTEFFELYKDEPANFKEFSAIPGVLDSFTWDTNTNAGTLLWNWEPSLVLNPRRTNNRLDSNILSAPASISASCYTNYSGTIELNFQFIKTQFHKGAVEVAIHYGRTIPNFDGVSNTYVKILNVQECTGFKVTIPYIYDTPVRMIPGTNHPAVLPDVMEPRDYAFDVSARVSVRVVNELNAPTSVMPFVDCIVWMNGGTDFGLTFPRACNNGAFMKPLAVTTGSALVYAPRFRGLYQQTASQPQLIYTSGSGISGVNATRIPPAIDLLNQKTQGDDDFSSNEYPGNRQTTIEHMNFKDILKLPVKILDHYPYTATQNLSNPAGAIQNYVSIPVAPVNNCLIRYLDDQYYYTLGSGAGMRGNSALQQSLQNTVTSMFGMYRGSMVYTVVAYNAQAPVYIQYVPHTYNLRPLLNSLALTQPSMNISGNLTAYNQPWIGIGPDNNIDLASTGLNHTFMLPAVNGSERVVVPHSSNTNWLLMNRDLQYHWTRSAAGRPTRLITPRENSEWFNGHLMIWSRANFTLTVYANCGDDVELGGFLGHTAITNPYAQFATLDAYRMQETQGDSDFNLQELTLSGWNSVKKITSSAVMGVTSTLLVSAMGCDTRVALGSLAVFAAANIANEGRIMARTVPAIREKVIDTPDGVVELAVEQLRSVIRELFPTLPQTTNLLKSLWIIAQNLVHAAFACNWRNTAYSIFNILLELKFLEPSDFVLVKDKLMDLVYSIFPGAQVTQADDCVWGAFIEIVFALICGKMQVKASGSIPAYLKDLFKYQNYKNISGLNSILLLIRTIMRAIQRIINYVFEKKDPNALLYAALTKQGAEMAEFVEDANLYLTTFNDNDLKKKDQRIRFLHCVLRAFNLRLILLKIAQPALTNQLLSVCNQVIKKANDQRYLFKCDILRTEPMVICVEGQTNIGKSFAVNEIIVRLFKQAKLTFNTPDIIYTIPTGVRYWNGYADQPVVWYDDWACIREPTIMAEQLSQLFALKTSASFNVPRAELENKEQNAAPEIVMMTTNVPFPKTETVSEHDALWRRRDVMVKATTVDNRPVSSFTPQELDSYAHLRFQFYTDSTQPDSLETKLHTFDEFIAIVGPKFTAFRANQAMVKEKKYKQLSSLLKTTPIDRVDLGNPFSIIETIEYNDENMVTTDKLTVEVDKLMNLVRAHMAEAAATPTDDDIFETQALDSIADGTRRFWRDFKQFAKDAPQNFGDWLGRGLHKLEHSLGTCDNCGAVIESVDIMFECTQAHHNMCMRCALFVCSQNQLRPAYHNGEWLFPCIEHRCDLREKSVGGLTRIVSNLVHAVAKPFIDAGALLAHLLGNRSFSNRTILVMRIRMAIRFIWFCALARMGLFIKYDPASPLNANDQRTQSDDVFRFNPLAYAQVPSVPIQSYSHIFETNREFLEFEGNRPKYVCAHSMLWFKYTYMDEQYTIHLPTDNVCIPDQPCTTTCCLRNVTFQKGVAANLEVSFDNMAAYQRGRNFVVAKFFPRFLRPTPTESTRRASDMVRKLTDSPWWQTYISPHGETFMTFAKCALGLVVAGTAFWGGHKLFKIVRTWIKTFFGADFDTETLMDSDAGCRPNARKAERRARGAQRSQRTQATGDCFEAKVNKISANCILIKRGTSVVSAWGVYNNKFLIPSHQRFIFGDGVHTIQFATRPHEKIEVLRDQFHINNVEGKDLLCVTVEGTKVLFKDCRKFMASQSRDNYPRRALMLDVDAKQCEVFDVDITITSMVHNTEARGPKGTFKNATGYMYDYQRPGACGSLVLVDEQFPILAMHISGSTETQKGIGTELLCVDQLVQSFPEFEDSGGPTIYYGEECNIEYCTAIETDLVPHVPTKSKIVPSLIDAQYTTPSLMMPAILHANHKEYAHEYPPLYYGVRKNGLPTLDFPKFYVEKAFEVVCDLMLVGEKIRVPTVLTPEESVMGLPIHVEDEFDRGEEEYYGAMVLSTSAGFPYSSRKYQLEYNIAKKDKTGWVQIEFENGLPSKCTIHPKLRSDHEKAMQIRSLGHPTLNVFQDCLKDEKRLITKAMKQGGTRLFSLANIEGTLALRRYTLDLTSHLRRNRITNGIAIGMNPESMEWTILGKTLQQMGNNIFTTDFTNFGAGLNFNCGMKFAQLVRNFFSRNNNPLATADENVVEALIAELMGSYHVVGDLIYRTRGGSPSGAAITTEMNSFVHLMYITLAWYIVGDVLKGLQHKGTIHNKHLLLPYGDLTDYLIKLKGTPPVFTGDTLRANLVMVVYGDDGIFSITDEYKEYFNARVINLVLKEHRIGVTDATKSDTIQPYGPLSEASFLKRSFAPNELLPNTAYMAQINWTVVEECTRWIRCKPLDPTDATRENCVSALYLAWGHGSEAYEKLRAELNKKLNNINISSIYMTWDDVASTFYPEIAFEGEESLRTNRPNLFVDANGDYYDLN